LSPDRCRWEEQTSPRACRVNTLKKQLTMELKVKQGAENFIQTYTSTSVKVGVSLTTPKTALIIVYMKSYPDITRGQRARETKQYFQRPAYLPANGEPSIIKVGPFKC